MDKKVVPLTEKQRLMAISTPMDFLYGGATQGGKTAYSKALKNGDWDTIPNHLSKPICRLERFIFEPCHRIAGGIKSACRAFMGFVKWYLIIMGCLATYYLVNFHRGWIDITILSQGDLKVLSGDLLKPAKEVKKTK